MELPWQKYHIYLLDIKSSPSPTGQNNNNKNVFNLVQFVNKNNLEAQNPSRDISIPSVSAGLGNCWHP